ncbi:hypothetical protein [Maliponia aquimaris]|uniref:hypothetical protein n=1 Tax=Maliponia aquimaris TaxID=1673631 RepID=UPI0011403E05|nr:hypothetical protein [Maliponia aquimaris]
MSLKEVSRLAIAIVLGVFLMVLGVPEAPSTKETISHSSETHPHGGENAAARADSSAGHCHPGLDCSVTAIFVQVLGQSYEPLFSESERHFSETLGPKVHTNVDPPPPRRTA